MPESDAPLHIALNESLCTGCLSCMLVCSERHYGATNLLRARIRIRLDPLTAEHSGITCHQCTDGPGGLAPCADICPQEAIQYDDTVRAWLVTEDDCISCGQCVDACPYGIMQLDIVTDIAQKCDLCQGQAHCVEACPTGALSLTDADGRVLMGGGATQQGVCQEDVFQKGASQEGGHGH
ncbi:MAG: 4Fe-4S dicluster domain-containing protein [Chloroflexi bacterium]|nr:4Fe-4S dicluster domain-containing protein [Chloroflexota bacterium]